MNRTAAIIITTNIIRVTATRTEAVRVTALARILTAGFGCLAAAWGATALPRYLRDHAIEQIAQSIILGESFPLEKLTELTPRLDAIELDTVCRPTALHSDAVIRLRIAETTLGVADLAHVDERLADARTAIGRSLACSPSDSFLWLGQYWVNVVSSGFSPEALKYLRMSYQLGPNEGWIIVKRNNAALAVFSSLPPDLAEQALTEFTKLFEPGLVQVAVDIFTGPGWPIRDVLLARIANKPQLLRQNFSNLLQARGYEIAVPGVSQKQRPWL
jgi:hypothetical protein